MLVHLCSLKMACVLLLLFLLASSAADPDDIGAGPEGTEAETPPEESADALVDPDIVSVGRQDADSKDSHILALMNKGKAEVREMASQVVSDRLRRIADENNMTTEEASQELQDVLLNVWYDVQEELVSRLWLDYSHVVANLTVLDLDALRKEYVTAQKRLKAVEDREGLCLVKYRGKCFWIDFHYDAGIKCAVAGYTCRSNGGRLANIYSEEHLEILQGHVRTLIVRQNEITNPAVSSWIGLRYSNQTDTTLLHDGSRAPYTAWREGYPTEAHNDCVSIRTTLQWSDLNQGFSNHARTDSAESVICEANMIT